MDTTINLELRYEIVRRWGTQQAAASALGVDRGTLTRVIRRQCSPSRAVVTALEKHFGKERVSEIFANSR